MNFREDGSFKILQLTDIHYVDGCDKDIRTSKLIESLIKEENPDLVVITGDTVYGPQNLKMTDKAFEPMVNSGIPWTFVFGNHDDEDGESREKLFEKISNMKGCLSYNDGTAGAGVGNHVIDIAQGKNAKWRLLFIDSGAYLEDDPKKGYDHIKESQIKWYKEKIGQLKASGHSAGAIAFFHIPLCEYTDVWDAGNCIGDKKEDVCPGVKNSGLADVMAGDGITRAVFAGHDHINNYMGNYKGVILGYGRATGYNTYSCDGYRHGARVIILNNKDTETFETYERLDDGSVLNYDLSHIQRKA